ncbi:hypothetical protein ACQBAR_12930 [Propionibacteriaceae bacterium Y1685]|uniref:hypothetical protein n=1 Tax=Microlunatus sp. Y1700 TaxID=3418487 RepID=UPI003B7C3D1C
MTTSEPESAAEMQRRADEAHEVFGGVYEAIRRDYEAKDSYEIVTLGVGADSRFNRCRVSQSWKGRGGVEALGAAMVEAYGRLDRKIDEALATEIADRQRNVTGRKAFIREDVAPSRPMTPRAPAASEVYGVVDQVMAAVDNVRRVAAEGVPAGAPSTSRGDITVTDPSGNVTARLENCVLTEFTVDETWAGRTSPIVMGEVFCDLLNAGLAEWSAGAAEEDQGEWQKAEQQFHAAEQHANGVLRRAGLV